MQEYLSENDYYNHYHSRERIGRKTYSSVEEIDTLLSKPTSWMQERILHNRKYTYIELRKLLEEKKVDLQNRKIYIRKLESIYDDPSEVLRFFKITDIFNCTYDEFGAIEYREPQVIIDRGTEKEVLITFEDVCTGFECGFDNFHDICEFKRYHDSISEVLT